MFVYFMKNINPLNEEIVACQISMDVMGLKQEELLAALYFQA